MVQKLVFVTNASGILAYQKFSTNFDFNQKNIAKTIKVNVYVVNVRKKREYSVPTWTAMLSKRFFISNM